MSKNQVWKTLLDQHDKLKKQASASLYDRVTLLTWVYEDPHFQTDMKKGKKSATAELDKRVSDTCANFTELLHMLRMFPKRNQWESGDLNEMRMKMLGSLSTGKKPKKNGRHNRKTATQAEVERLKRELKFANDSIRSLQHQLETAQVTIGSLNETISLFKLERQGKSQTKAKQTA
jgi:chromosome segregation ATPase